MEFEHKTLFLDIETTGLVPNIEVPGKRPGTTKKQQLPYETGYNDYPYIVSIAWKVNNEEAVEFVLNQEGREIPEEASNIHNITTEIAAKSDTTFEEAIMLLLDDAAGIEIVVGHGLYFDTSILKANVLRGIEKKTLLPQTIETITEMLHKYKRIDTMRSSIKIMKKWCSLSDLHMKLFRKGFVAHVAKNDVEATARCYEWLLRKEIVPTWEKLQEKAEEKAKAA